MSTELSSAPLIFKEATGVDCISGKSKVKSSDKTDISEESLFSVVLTSHTSLKKDINSAGSRINGRDCKGMLGVVSDPAAEGGLSVALPPLESSMEKDDVACPFITPDDLPPLIVLPASESLIPSASSATIDLGMLLAQAGEVTGDKLNYPAEVRAAKLTATTATTATTANIIGADKVRGANEILVAAGTEKTETLTQHINTLLAQVEQIVPGQSHLTKSFGLQSGVAAGLAESRALKQVSLSDMIPRETLVTGALFIRGMGDDFVRPVDRSASKAPFAFAGAGIEGIWGQSVLQNGNRVDAASVMVGPSMQSVETMVADKVNFWVTQGVQNAELKLDSFGGGSVQVSISLSGDEAHIAFRTDQPEIRQMLEGAVAHLKDLLSSEGLVLSGVSVGASGQNGADAQEQGKGNRSGTSKTMVVTTSAISTEGLQRVNKSTERALDLYV
jgi:hypothetical protein